MAPSRRAGELASRRARERQETEPASSTPSTRAVLNAPSEMPWPCAAVFRLSSPLVAHSAHAWPFAVAIANLFRRSKRSRRRLSLRLRSWSAIAMAIVTLGIRPLVRYGGARAIRDSPSDVAACHRVVRRHTCSPVTRRSTRARQAQAAPRAHAGCRPVSPKGAIKASHETRSRPEECLGSTMAGRLRELFVTKHHKRHDLTFFSGHFRGRVHLKVKSATWSPAYINETKTPTIFVTQVAMSPREKFLVRGCRKKRVQSMAGVSWGVTITRPAHVPHNKGAGGRLPKARRARQHKSAVTTAYDHDITYHNHNEQIPCGL